MTYFPFLLGDSFGLSSLIIGLIMASVSLIAAFTFSQLVKIIKPFSKKTILKMSFFLCNYLWNCSRYEYPVIQALLVEATPLNYRATFMSVSGMTFRVGQTLGSFLMGLVIGVWGIGGAFYAGAVI